MGRRSQLPGNSLGMETLFNPDHAILIWKMALSRQSGFRTEDVAELEAHLRDSLPRLTQVGLTEEEAFLVARNAFKIGVDIDLDRIFPLRLSGGSRGGGGFKSTCRLECPGCAEPKPRHPWPKTSTDRPEDRGFWMCIHMERS